MPTKYNLNPVLKRIIQDFEEAIKAKVWMYTQPIEEQEAIEEEYQEAKTNLIDLIGEMDQEIYGKGGGLSSPAAKRNRARKKYTRSVQGRADKNMSVASAKLKQKKKARVGKQK